MTEYVLGSQENDSEISEFEQYKESGRDLHPTDLSNEQIMSDAHDNYTAAQVAEQMSQHMPEGFEVSIQTVGLTWQWWNCVDSGPGAHPRQILTEPPFAQVIRICNRAEGSA